MLELKISLGYPNKYWFEYKHPNILASDFLKGAEFDLSERFNFYLKNRVSEKSLFSYDFYFSDGPLVISPRLVSVLLGANEFLSGIQLLDATMHINNAEYSGYKVLNVIDAISCIDMERSDSQLILSYLPNGPRKFNKIVFKNGISENFSLARCQEHNSSLVISQSFRDFLLNKNAKGIDLSL
ncbi:imm11 family protein [Kosakonia sp. AX9b]